MAHTSCFSNLEVFSLIYGFCINLDENRNDFED
jgi:hypothetical protein